MTAQRSGLPKGFMLAAVLSPLALSGCLSSGGSGGGSGSNGVCSEFDCEQMLSNLGGNVMQPAMEDFQDKAQTLEAKASEYSQSLNQDGNAQDASARTGVQEAWNAAMLSWQEVEMMQVGPLVDNSAALRDNIYSWPGRSTCGVDQEVIKASEEGDGYDITLRTPTRKGLAAIEYIAYTESLEDTCPANSDGVSGWDSKPEDQKRAERAFYLKQASAAVADRSDELVAAWTGDNGFRQELANPGSDGSRFDGPQEAVNAVSDALFYIEKQVKDIKLAEPLCGDKSDCPDNGEVSPEKVENPFSARSKEHVRANFVAFQTLFLGNEEGASPQPGFDDLLDAINEENVSSMMSTDIQQSLDDLDKVQGSFQAALQPGNTAGEDAVRDVWESAQDVTDRLKNDFLTALSLSIPDAAAGDGD